MNKKKKLAGVLIEANSQKLTDKVPPQLKRLKELFSLEDDWFPFETKFLCQVVNRKHVFSVQVFYETELIAQFHLMNGQIQGLVHQEWYERIKDDAEQWLETEDLTIELIPLTEEFAI